jgi:hypothetical protein
MDKLKTFLYSILLIPFLFSCSEDTSFSGDVINFGKAEYFEQFLGVESDTIIIERKLKFNFNDYATKKESYVKIRLVDVDNKTITDNNILLYSNGELVKNKTIKISSTDNQNGVVIIGIRLLPKYKKGYTSGFISVTSHSLDRINENDIATSSEKRLFKWEAEHSVIMNPLKKGLMWLLIVIASLLLLWFAVLRNSFYPKFKKGKIQILNPYFKGIKIDKSVMQIVFTNKKHTQGFFSKLFKGMIQYEINDLYDRRILFTPGRGNKIKIKLPLGYKIKPIVSNLDKFNTYKIDINKQIIEIQYV